MKRFLKAVCLLILVLPAVAVIGLFAMTFFLGLSSTAACTLSSGRSIVASSDSITLTGEFGADTATIKTAGRTIVVQKTALLIDGENVGDIDETVAKVEVIVKRGSIKFVADGKPVDIANR